MGSRNAETMINLSFLLTDDELCKIAGLAVRNDTHRLYSGNLLGKRLLAESLAR